MLIHHSNWLQTSLTQWAPQFWRRKELIEIWTEERERDRRERGTDKKRASSLLAECREGIATEVFHKVIRCSGRHPPHAMILRQNLPIYCADTHSPQQLARACIANIHLLKPDAFGVIQYPAITNSRQHSPPLSSCTFYHFDSYKNLLYHALLSCCCAPTSLGHLFLTKGETERETERGQ